MTDRIPTIAELSYKIGQLEAQLAALAARQSHPLAGWTAHQLTVDPDPNVADTTFDHPVTWVAAGAGLVAMVLDAATGRAQAIPNATSTQAWALTPPGGRKNLTTAYAGIRAARQAQKDATRKALTEAAAKATADAEELAHTAAQTRADEARRRARPHADKVADALDALDTARRLAQPRTPNENAA